MRDRNSPFGAGPRDSVSLNSKPAQPTLFTLGVGAGEEGSSFSY